MLVSIHHVRYVAVANRCPLRALRTVYHTRYHAYQQLGRVAGHCSRLCLVIVVLANACHRCRRHLCGCGCGSGWYRRHLRICRKVYQNTPRSEKHELPKTIIIPRWGESARSIREKISRKFAVVPAVATAISCRNNRSGGVGVGEAAHHWNDTGFPPTSNAAISTGLGRDEDCRSVRIITAISTS